MTSDMSNTKTTGNWQVKRASVSERDNGLYLEGFNYYTGQNFFWHVTASVNNPEYDFTDCDWQSGALTVGTRLLGK